MAIIGGGGPPWRGNRDRKPEGIKGEIWERFQKMKGEIVQDAQLRLRVVRVGDNVTTIGEVLDNPHDFIVEDEIAPVGEEDSLRGNRPLMALAAKANEICAQEMRDRLLKEFPQNEKEIDEIGIEQMFLYWPRKGEPPLSERT